MGQIYSFLGYTDTVGKNNNLEAIFAENFSCGICWRVLHDPVQCRNEHYFCRSCIKRRLESFDSCPSCPDQMTVDSLRPPCRIVTNVVSKMNKPRCRHVSQSCEDVNVEELLPHERIYIFGGYFDDKVGKSVEIFDWSTKKWTLVEDCLFFPRDNSFSFVYNDKIMVCGGDWTEGIEYLNPSENGYTSTAFSTSLPNNGQRNGVLYENRIFTFKRGIVETSLEQLGESKTLKEEERDRDYAGVHRFGNDIYVIGGQQSRIEKYDVAKNELNTLPPVPYKVSNMATVAYKDNIILLGGTSNSRWSECKPLNDVTMFNVATQEYKKLPHMLEKRSGCAAVILGDVIVVMGGETDDEKSLDSVECYVIGNSAWQKLPAMNQARFSPTACVLG